MTIIIQKFSKDLKIVDDIQVNLDSVSGITISHYDGFVSAYGLQIPYIIEGVEKHIPDYIENIEFCNVIRKKINLGSIGPNCQAISKASDDVGKYDQVNKKPSESLDLPPGFKEIYKGK